MSPRTKRLILRWIHIVFTLPILGYVYSPFALLPSYAFVARYISVPILMLSGFWMWIGSAPKKSVLVPAGVFLILLGLIGPLPLAPAAQSMPSGTLRSVSYLAVNLFRLGFLVGIVCAVIGVRWNRKLKQSLSTETA